MMHEDGLGFLLLRYCPPWDKNIRAELGSLPPCLPPCLPLPALPSLSLPLFSFSGPVEVVFCHIYTFSQIEKTSRDPDYRECEWLESIKGLNPPITFNHFTTCMEAILFYLLFIQRWFTGNASPKGKKFGVIKGHATMARNEAS